MCFKLTQSLNQQYILSPVTNLLWSIVIDGLSDKRGHSVVGKQCRRKDSHITAGGNGVQLPYCWFLQEASRLWSVVQTGKRLLGYLIFVWWSYTGRHHAVSFYYNNTKFLLVPFCLYSILTITLCACSPTYQRYFFNYVEIFTLLVLSNSFVSCQITLIFFLFELKLP